jgi:hypothetical protein
MPRFRIFTNDRGKVRGKPMYSCLTEVVAADPEAARRKCPPQFDSPAYAPAVAIHWPESTQSDNEKLWLKEHVAEVN